MTTTAQEVTVAQRAVRHHSPWYEAWRRFRRNRLALAGAGIAVGVVLIAILASFLAPYDPTATKPYEKFLPPSSTHIMGTDSLGRDVFSRVLYGAQVSVQVGLIVIAVGIALGVPLGALAGYNAHTVWDEAIMRTLDILIAFPPLILAIAVMGAMGPRPVDFGFFTLSNLGKVMIVIGLVLVPRFARVMRSAVLKEKAEEYVDAARTIGMGSAGVLFSEILPNTLAPIIVQATYYMATAILTESALSFLGIGIQPPTPSWGQMLSEARSYLISGQWWFSVFPGMGIFITMIGFNLLGDGLRDALDPRVAE
ncbi:MAG: ABC transporter permease [Caldilineaceae bacterium]|nr:ABC transporter permease [Caldilineaceae bacterium]